MSRISPTLNYKVREFKEHNYKSIYVNGKTLRLTFDPSKPITDLDYPEFYDIKLTNNCSGNCDWCYQNSINEPHFDNIIKKFESFFGPMTANQRPFQIAYGGGEPTSHPDFTTLLKKTYEYGITPNYTTNGMHVTKTLVNVTKEYCGGVAISCHPHLEKYWKKAADLYLKKDIILNFHLIISDEESIDKFKEIYETWKDRVEYFVLLPFIPQGRGKSISKKLDEEYFTKIILELKDKYGYKLSDIAFGANFYKYLCKNSNVIDLDISLYEPEIMSKYLSFENNGYLYPSSFNIDTVLKENFLL